MAPKMEKAASDISSVARGISFLFVLLALLLVICVFTGTFAGFDEGIWALSVLFGMVLGLVLARIVVLEKARG